MLTTDQFERTRRLALRLAGIELSGRHRDTLQRRGSRLGLSDDRRWEALIQAAESDDPAAVRQALHLVTTSYTSFFRHPRHFEAAAEAAVAAARRRGVARLWSAAAATGEEPYSLAMALVEAFGHEAPPAAILATDVNAEVLSAAMRGQYTKRALTSLDAARRLRHFVERGDGLREVVPGLRCMVSFRVLNLVDPGARLEGPFDVIFCRNVLMYLEVEHRRAVLERLGALLAAEGLLILDPTEHLGRAAHLFRAVGEGIYRHRPAGVLRDTALRGRLCPT